jgi:type IV pilus assembly protein PilF
MRRSVFLAVATAAALLAGCAGTEVVPQSPTGVDTGTVVGEVGDPRNRAKLHTELASAYYQRGSMGVALEELRTAVAADPSYPTAHGMFGLVYMELRENQLAEQSFERALKLSPTDPDINHNYAWFLCQTKREPDSIKYFLQAIRNPLYQQPQRSYAAAGQCALKVNKLKDAEELLQRALKIDSDDANALLQMGQLRYRQGNMDDARRLALRYGRVAAPTAESLWLAVRVERKLGERNAEASYANQLRRRFPGSAEYQALQRGEFD